MQGALATSAHAPDSPSADLQPAPSSTYLPGHLLSQLLLRAGGDEQHLVVLLSAYAAAVVMVSQSIPQQQPDMVLNKAFQAAQQQLENVLVTAGDVSMLDTCQKTLAALNSTADPAGPVGSTDVCMTDAAGLRAAEAYPALQLQPAAACPGW
jgi:hypothetical protein